jgi:hypothetical protein
MLGLSNAIRHIRPVKALFLAAIEVAFSIFAFVGAQELLRYTTRSETLASTDAIKLFR